jgi:predicted ribonuclease YlaK
MMENASDALVCANCSRDVSVPVSLINERDNLIRKRDALREELSNAKRALEDLRSTTRRSA